ncbi:MAG TPA: hypothetical protein VL119_12385 [Acidimicrobiia bacterium]|nr:hypothetical protein [Acidimicrobiia bacterium]
MDLVSFFRTIGRHVTLTILGLVVTIALTAAVVKRVQPTYQTTGTLLITGPNTSVGQNGQIQESNPANALTTQLETYGSVIASIVNGEAVTSHIKSLGLSPGYSVTVDNFSPVLDISTLASTPSRSQATFDQVKREIDQASTTTQESVGSPKSQLIKLVGLTGPTTKPQTSARQRVGLGVLALGIVATIAFVSLLDFAQRRRRDPTRTRRPKGRRRDSRRKRKKSTTEPGEPIGDEPRIGSPAANDPGGLVAHGFDGLRRDEELSPLFDS